MLLSFELICAVNIITLNSLPCSKLVEIWICRKIKRHLPSLALLGWAGCIITSNFVWQYPNLSTLYVQYTKNPDIKNLLPFELICAVYLESIVTSNFVQHYPFLMTLNVQYTKKPAIKQCFSFELICAVYLEYIVTSKFVRPYPIILTLYVQ